MAEGQSKSISHADMFQPLVYQILNDTDGYIRMLTHDELRQYTWRRLVLHRREYAQSGERLGFMHKRMDNKPLTSAELPNLHPQV